jgi:GntR family transcriptional regulator
MLERKVPVPLYHQLELQLRAAIESGKYRPGDRLPTESELQQAYQVSRVTVRTALKRLEEDGLISTVRGSGTFVSKQAEASQIERHSSHLLGFEEDLIQQAGSPAIVVLSVEEYPVSGRIAQLLEVEPGLETTRIRRVGSVAGEPLWIESRWLHPDFAGALSESDLESASLTALYETRVGLHIESSRLRISAGAATSEQARYLHIEAGEPVLINEYAVYTGSKPIDATRSIFRGDRYAFAFEVSASNHTGGSSKQGANSTKRMVSVIRQEVSV